MIHHTHNPPEPTYVIRRADGKYLTKLMPGKHRRGWSNYLNQAAVFDTMDVAKWTLGALGRPVRTAKVEPFPAD